MRYSPSSRSLKAAIQVIGGFIALLTVLGVIGWVMNIVALLGMTSSGNEGELIARVLGVIIPPAGAILGYF